MKKKLLFLFPRDFDYHELGRLSLDCDILYYSLNNKNLPSIMCDGIGKVADNFDPPVVREDMLHVCERNKIEGVLSTWDPSSLFASSLIKEKKYPGPSIESVLLCQHKYQSRIKQKELVPHAIPAFALLNQQNFNLHSFDIPFPVFVKPVKSSFSIFAHKAESGSQLYSFLQSCQMPKEYIDQFNWFLQNYSSFSLENNDVLVEKLLEGVQVTLEGYVFRGKVTIMGVVDSIMFPGTISFKRFEYPSVIDEDIQQRMASIASDFVSGIGLDNTLFNIEFMYNRDDNSIAIIEVHPRMSAQFADLFEKVDGTNSYEILLALSQNKEPIMHRRKGLCNVASCFVLRTFQDKRVIAVPTIVDQQNVYQRFPDARLYLYPQPGMKLSDLKQDGKSYRYGLVHLGARDRKELFEKFTACERMLPFDFA